MVGRRTPKPGRPKPPPVQAPAIAPAVSRYRLEDARNVAMLQALFYMHFGYGEEAAVHRDEALRLAAELGVVPERPKGGD